MNILVTTQLPNEGFDSLRTQHEIVIPQSPYFSHEQLLEYAQWCHIIVPTYDYPLPESIINSMPNLRLIATLVLDLII